MRKKVLLFADVGIDDAVVLIYALLHPRIRVLGVVASFGNTPRKLLLIVPWQSCNLLHR
ncbi:hypothetical protein C1X05_03390 [Laceyella sacchari]|nr:hypothetical protein C1X05_03390 [Laceyella sacchari]MRG29825.1 hypothetical protein [Laceyella tengchongensis]